ncbi:MAG: tocopherol cyclase family protein [Salinivirgaceae bacterium]
MKNIQALCLLTVLFLCVVFSSVNAQDLEKQINFSEQKFLPFYNVKKTFNTTIFQGNKKTRKYFEGWYFKMVAEDGAAILSVIPGISLSSDGKEQHAFIQLINGVTSQTSYYSFPIEEFSFSKKHFAIKIGDNYFSKNGVVLHLKNDNSHVSGTIEMSNHVEYTSRRLLNPGIMGWYRFVPFMQCYHGVVSITNNLQGKLIIGNEEYDFNGGQGYIEKDWGSSMPSAWIWMQSNHFSHSNSSFMLSIADIPWLGKSFTGFLGFFYHNNKIHHFATYRSTKLQLEIPDSTRLNIKIENRKNTFILHAKSNNSGLLTAPAEGAMDRRISESIDAVLKITMLDRKGNVVFVDSSTITGLEMVGDYKKLQGLLK